MTKSGKNNVLNPQRLDYDDEVIWGGSGGDRHSVTRMAHGRFWATNLHTAANEQDVRISYWSDVDTDGIRIVNFRNPVIPEGSDPGSATMNVRFGDAMSIDIDENGNGYIFNMGSRMLCVMRIPVTNFTEVNNDNITYIIPGTYPIPDPVPGTPTRAPISFQTYQKVDGSTNEYLYTSNIEPVHLVNADGTLLYTMTSFSDHFDGCAARIVLFNGARYLVTMNDTGTGGEGIIAMYDITDGATTLEALQNFDNRSAEDKEPAYTYSLEGTLLNAATIDGACAVGINFAKDDNTLYIIGSAVDAGFAIIEFKAAQ